MKDFLQIPPEGSPVEIWNDVQDYFRRERREKIKTVLADPDESVIAADIYIAFKEVHAEKENTEDKQISIVKLLNEIESLMLENADE